MNTPQKHEIVNAWLCQIKDDSIEPIFCDFSIENNVIKNIRPKSFDDFISNKRPANKNQYDAGGKVVTTPLVNFHDHIYSRLAKGLPTLGPQDNFHNVLKNLWWQLDKALDNKMIKASAKLAALESIRNGVTYIFDHHASPMAIKNSLNTIAAELKNHGLSSALCYEISDRDGDEITKTALEETVKFVNSELGENVAAFVGLHASFTLKEKTLERVSHLVSANNMGIHIHLCEDGVDREISISEFGKTPIERLKHHNLMNPKSILSHGIHLTDDDYSAIAKEGCVIAYNPDSNMNNAVGVPSFAKVPDQIPIITGTDGMHANIARSLKQLYLLTRHQKNDFGTAFGWFIKIFFDQIKFVRKYFPNYPSLVEGDRADLIIWDYVPPTPFNNENFWGHYIYGILERPVKTVIQNGEFLMKDFQLMVGDEDEAMREIYEQGNNLYNAMKKIEASN